MRFKKYSPFPVQIYKFRDAANSVFKKHYKNNRTEILNRSEHNFLWKSDCLSTKDKDNTDLLPWEDIFKMVSSKVIGMLKDQDSPDCNITITDYWINIAQLGGFQEVHQHSGDGTNLVVVYFLKFPKGSGDLYILNPEFAFYGSTDLNLIYNKNILSPFMKLNAKEGDVILFPANLNHFTGPQKIDKDRVTLSFNIKLSLR